jgi:predicted amidohydrolase
MRVAIGQFGAQLGNVRANLDRMQTMLAEAARADAEVVCFPELSLSGYLLDAGAYTPQLMGEVADAVDELAADSARHDMTLVYGAPQRVDGGLRNAVIMQPPSGSRLVYAKTHLDAVERAVFDRGDRFVVEQRGIGAACCYDLAFPELARAVALLGARLLVVPMAWEVKRAFVMLNVVPARAVENVLYVLCANQCGKIGPFTFRGGSCVVDPLGRMCVRLGDEEGLAVSDLELDWVSRLRDRRDDRSYPLVADRRPELYEILTYEGSELRGDEDKAAKTMVDR